MRCGKKEVAGNSPEICTKGEFACCTLLELIPTTLHRRLWAILSSTFMAELWPLRALALVAGLWIDSMRQLILILLAGVPLWRPFSSSSATLFGGSSQVVSSLATVLLPRLRRKESGDGHDCFSDLSCRVLFVKSEDLAVIFVYLEVLYVKLYHHRL
jgi:hypothetical protein